MALRPVGYPVLMSALQIILFLLAWPVAIGLFLTLWANRVTMLPMKWNKTPDEDTWTTDLPDLEGTGVITATVPHTAEVHFGSGDHRHLPEMGRCRTHDRELHRCSADGGGVMSLNAFARDEDLRGTHWQFVGDTMGSRTVTIRAGHETEGKWSYLPPIEVVATEGQTQKDRFNEWVDRFIRAGKESA